MNKFMYCSDLQKYIKDKFPLAFDISIMCPIYLMGGALRDFEVDRKPKDLDFVCLDYDNIIELFLEKFNIEYTINNLGGYKIKCDDIEVDLWSTTDLYDAVQYNADGLFYDVKNNYLIPFGYNDALKNGIKLINSNNNIKNEERRSERLKKLQRHIRQK